MEAFWFKWYPARYRAATMHLTAEQDGIYRRLIDHYMETRKPLPDHPSSLARIAGVDCSAFAAAFGDLEPFFSRGADGLLHLRTCDEVLSEQDDLSRKRSRSGKLGAGKTNDLKRKSGTCRPNAEQVSGITPAREEKRREEESEAKASASSAQRASAAAEVTFWIMKRLNATTPFTYAAVDQWLTNGADFELDIKPVIERFAASDRPPPRSLALFTEDVASSIRQRGSPMPTTRKGDYHGKQPNKDERLRNSVARAAERLGFAD